MLCFVSPKLFDAQRFCFFLRHSFTLSHDCHGWQDPGARFVSNRSVPPTPGRRHCFQRLPDSGSGILESFHPPFARHALRFETNRAPAQTRFGVAITGSFPKDIENMGAKNFSTTAKFGIMPKVMGSS